MKRVTRDVPPYLTLDGLSSLVVGLNQIGLRRAGYSSDDVLRQPVEDVAAVEAIEKLIKATQSRWIILSYSSGGRATAGH